MIVSGFDIITVGHNLRRNEFYELRHRLGINVEPLPELAALGPAYDVWPHASAKMIVTRR